MAESTQIVFSHKEVVEALLKQQGIHDGIWGIYIKFGLQGVNVGASPADLMPAAVIPVLQIGLQKFDEENNLAVDAAKVNPQGLPLVAPPPLKPRGAKK
jgi:hypothetical protein